MKTLNAQPKNLTQLLNTQMLDKKTRDEIWEKAAGLLKHKKIDPLGYQKNIRKGWEERLQRQIKLGSHGS